MKEHIVYLISFTCAEQFMEVLEISVIMTNAHRGWR